MTAGPEHDDRYDLFISYARRPDYRLARHLEAYLESFHQLAALREKKLPALRVCRDGGDFALGARTRVASTANVDAVESLVRPYLRKSRRLLVLCSPNAATSRWVRAEIDWFLEENPDGVILAAVTEGDPVATPERVFPPRLVELGLHRRPWYEFRGFRAPARERDAHQAYEEAFVQLVTELVTERQGGEPGDLFPAWQQEQQRARRLTRRNRTTGSLLGAALLVAVAWLAWRNSRTSTANRRGAAEAEADRAITLAAPGPEANPALAFHLALQAAADAPAGEPATQYHVARVLHLAATLPRRVVVLRGLGAELARATLSPDGTRLLAVTRERDVFRVAMWDPRDGTPVPLPFIGDRRVGTPGDLVTGGPGYGMDAIEFSADGSLAKAMTGGDTLWVWRTHGDSLVAAIAVDYGDRPRFSAAGDAVLASPEYCPGAERAGAARRAGCCSRVIWRRAGPAAAAGARATADCGAAADSEPPAVRLVYRGGRPVLVDSGAARDPGQAIESVGGRWAAAGTSPDGRLLSAVSTRGWVYTWDRDARPLERALAFRDSVVDARVSLAPPGLLLLTADGRLVLRSHAGDVLWSARLGAARVARGRFWPTGDTTTFLVTHAADDDPSSEGAVELWKVGEQQARGVARRMSSGVSDVAVRDDGRGGVVAVTGEEEYDYLHRWEFDRPTASLGNVERLRFGGFTRDARTRLDGDSGTIHVSAADSGPGRPPAFVFAAGAAWGKTVMALLRETHGVARTPTGIRATLPGGQRVTLDTATTGARLAVNGVAVPLSAAYEEDLLGLSTDGTLRLGLRRYRSAGGRIGAMYDLVVRELTTGRVLAAHQRVDGGHFIGLTPGNRAALIADFAGRVREYWIHDGRREAPPWFAELGPALTRTRSTADGKLAGLSDAEYAQLRTRVRAELERARAAGDRAAGEVLDLFFREPVAPAR